MQNVVEARAVVAGGRQVADDGAVAVARGVGRVEEAACSAVDEAALFVSLRVLRACGVKGWSSEME